jgi:hypothetical protein
VESVDPLSTDEAYESIGADMPDHDRRPSCAYLLSCVPMNTRRRAHRVSGRAKPPMMISVELQILLKTCFLYAVMRVLKVIEAVWSIDQEPLTFCTLRCAC